LHSHGICHLDLKPRNILLLDGRAKVIDYGISKGNAESTRVTQLSYTPRYFAPEQLKGQLTLKIDIWALGCLIFYLFCEVEPWFFVHNDKFGFKVFELMQQNKNLIDDIPDIKARELCTQRLQECGLYETIKKCLNY
jgi:serine/threonine protein kinase